MKVENVFVTVVLLLISSKRTFQQFARCGKSDFLHEGSCTPCPARCATCISGLKCTKCNSNYYGQVCQYTLQQTAICPIAAYRQEGSCKWCPERCATCISDRNCTKCNSNYYGPVCQYTCQQDCEDLCHKEYGYCTYGCVDGMFPEENSPYCANCPPECKKCKSLTECIECSSGYYGNTCEIRCFGYCETCNKTTGACLVCAEGFNKEGQCRRCPDGCMSCSDENNCSSCQSGYYTLKDGQCIMECPIASNTSDLYSTTYLTRDRVAHGCTDTARGQRFVIKTKKPCIQYSKCSPNIMCTPQYEGKSPCGTIKTYQCSHSCRQLNESYYRCEPNCILIEESLFSMTLCFTNEHAFTDIKLSTESECSNTLQVSDTILRYSYTYDGDSCGGEVWKRKNVVYNALDDSQHVNVLAVVLIVVIVVVVAFVSLVFICLTKRHHMLRKSRREDVEINPSADEDTFVKYVIDKGQTEIGKPYDETAITRHLQDDLEIDETSCLNENDIKDATLDTLKTEETSMPIREDPNKKSSNVDSSPYTRGSQSTGSYQPTNPFGGGALTLLTQCTHNTQMN